VEGEISVLVIGNLEIQWIRILQGTIIF
jgi:hypothetical protein